MYIYIFIMIHSLNNINNKIINIIIIYINIWYIFLKFNRYFNNNSFSLYFSHLYVYV